tara:strand:+ start:4526 stop:5026 length:501 start_codon:yes stop_codon:yes gene_type:complete
MNDPLDRPSHDDLQLKTGIYADRFSEVLHSSFPKDWSSLFLFMDALDFVVEQWKESMVYYGLGEEAELAASEVLIQNAVTRWVIYQFVAEDNEDVDFVEVMKELNELKQCYVDIAKSYARDPILSHWYLNLPLHVSGSFKAIRQKERIERMKEDLYNAEARKALYK